MSLNLTKKELRIIYKQKRSALSSDEVIFLSEKIFENFIDRFEIKPNSHIHCFISIPSKKEVETKSFFNYCFENDIRVYVPKIVGENLISVEIFSNTEFETNNWGVIEPVSNVAAEVVTFDYCITPLLYCDAHGNRVGYGKGFYDKFFEKSNVNMKIGVNFFEINEIVSDFNINDISLDFLVTPFSVKGF